jgi:hypothetical protein
VLNAFSPADLAALRSDPEAAALGIAQDWAGLAAHLGAHAGGRRPSGPVPRAVFLEKTLQVMVRLKDADAGTRWLWSEIRADIRESETIRPDLPGVAALLASAVAAGLLTPAERDEITTVPASRAEALLGRALAPLTPEDLESQWPAD